MRSEAASTTRNAEVPLASMAGKSSVLLLLALLLFYGLGGAGVSASVSGNASFEVVDADLPSDTRNDIDPFLPQWPFCLPECKLSACVATGFDSRPATLLTVYRSRAPPFV